MKISFEIWGVPKAQLRPRHRRWKKKSGETITQTYDPTVSADWKDLVIRQVEKHRPEKPALGPIRLSLTFLMPVPKTTPKYKKAAIEAGEKILHTKAPDLDQLEKPLMDMLQNAAYYYSDSQVAERPHSEKIYALRPGVKVTVEEVEQRFTI